MNIEAHIKMIKESLDEIKTALNVDLTNKQRTIGFHCSAAITDMLEMYFHSKNLIDPGANIKHNFFGSIPMALRKLPKEFEHKQELIKLLVKIEEKRNVLCYGKPQPLGYIENYLDLFKQARNILESMGVKI